MNSVFNRAKEKMEKSVSSLKFEYNSIRAGRANAAVLDRIQVDYYGCPTPINQMAAI
jgi:ribosome recycling factor